MSELFTLDTRDILRGLIVAVLTAFLSTVAQILQLGALPDMAALKTSGIYALAAGASYLLKNFATNSKDKILTKEEK